MSKPLMNVVVFVGAFTLMAAGGFAAFTWALTVLMRLGTKHHDIYDYYGYTHPLLSAMFVFGTVLAGFVAPGVIVWRLQKHSWRVSLRTLLVATTVAAIILATCACFATL